MATKQTGLLMLDDLDMDGNSILNAVIEGSHAEMYMVTPAATAAITATTYLKIGGTTGAGTKSSDFTITTTSGGRLQYTGATAKAFHVSGSISMTGTVTNQIAKFRLYVYDDSGASGATVSKSEVHRKIGTGSDVGAAGISGIVTLDTSDYLELWCTLTTSSSDTLTIEALNLILAEV